MKKLAAIMVVIMLVLSICGCAQSLPASSPDKTENTPAQTSAVATVEPTPADKPEESPSTEASGSSLAGVIDGDQYTNDMLGFSVTIPEGWVFATDDEIATLFGQAKDMVDGITTLPENSQVFLMVCSEKPLTGSTNNPNINVGVSNQYGNLSKAMYDPLLAQLKTTYDAMYKQMGADSVDVTGEASCAINGKEYIHFSVVAKFPSMSLYQEQYFMPVGAYAMTVTQTYYDAEQKDAMDTFMQNITYGNAA